MPWVDCALQWLDCLLPANAAELCTGAITVIIATFPSMEQVGSSRMPGAHH